MTKTRAPLLLPKVSGASYPNTPNTKSSLPSSPNSKKPLSERKNSKNLIGILLFMGAGFLLWLAFGPQNQNVNHPSERHDLSHVENVVNKHLILTNKKIELAQEAARLKNVQTIPAVGEQILPRWKPSEVVGVDQSYDRNELNAARDLARHPELSLNSPGAIVQSEMADSEVTTQLESEQREEYARQFIQNARAGGYDVELDENYRVKKVRKIRPVGPTQAQGGAAR